MHLLYVGCYAYLTPGNTGKSQLISELPPQTGEEDSPVPAEGT